MSEDPGRVLDVARGIPSTFLNKLDDAIRVGLSIIHVYTQVWGKGGHYP